MSLYNMTKGLIAAMERADAFRAASARVGRKKTEKPGDLVPPRDPIDGSPWKPSTLRRHRRACAAGYAAMADTWASFAADLRVAISAERKRLKLDKDS